jgi:hypothetical protein
MPHKGLQCPRIDSTGRQGAAGSRNAALMTPRSLRKLCLGVGGSNHRGSSDELVATRWQNAVAAFADYLFKPKQRGQGSLGHSICIFRIREKCSVADCLKTRTPMVSRISLLLLTIASLILTAYFGAEAWRVSDPALADGLTEILLLSK